MNHQDAARKLRRSGPCPRQDSNLRTRLRRPALYPLSYEGANSSLATGHSGPGSDYELGGRSATVRPAVASDATPVILVVDDDPVIVRLLEINLSLEGFAIFTATNGADAVKLAREKLPALVLLDLMMPGMDGWAVREALLEDPSTARIPVVVVSARTQDEDRERGYALDVAAYITKPFDPAELVETVRRFIARPPAE